MENNFGSFLRERRLEKNLTQKELAKMLFVSESAVSKWEKNVARPDITLLPSLSLILGVTEHEIITASVDNKAREEKRDARKWRTVSLSWTLFFYISYGIAILTCFICNLAVNKTLSWFWIVLSALLLSFSFTNLPRLLKKNRLLLLPLASYFSLVLLLGVCCIYSGGNWFFISILSVLLGMVMIFTPIYISKFDCFSKIKRYNDFITVGISFFILNILFIVIEAFSLSNGFSLEPWYISLALPISGAVYLFLNICLSVRFLKLNRFLKTSIILFLIDMLYIIPIFLRVQNPELQKEINEANILNADFSNWSADQSLSNNIHLIVFLTLLLLLSAFLIVGVIRNNKKKK